MLTAHQPPQWMLDEADYITEMKCHRHPYQKGGPGAKGDRILTPQHHLPADIERTSLKMIAAELAELGLTPPPETEAVVRRVIHTTADFDYAKNLRFTPGAVQKAVEALHKGAFIVTDTNMALAGITKPGLAKLGGQAACYMADPEVAARAKAEGTTRAVAAMQSSRRAPGGHPGRRQCTHSPAHHCGAD